MIFGMQFFYLSQSTRNLQPIDMQHVPLWKTSYFISWQDPRATILPWAWGRRSEVCGFWAHGFYFFWKYITFAIDWHIIWPYLENLIFHVLLIFWIITNNSCSTILIFHSKIFNNHFLFVWEYYIGSY